MKIHSLVLTMTALLLAACSSDTDMTVPQTLSPDGQKTPINIVTNITTDGDVAATRAVDKTFHASDQLIAYLQTVKTEGLEVKYSHMETFTVAREITSVDEGPTSTSNLAPTIYWDDYSSSAYSLSDGVTYGVRLLYGYCYNGGTPSTPLNETTTATGILGWTVSTNQNTIEDGIPVNFRHSDLLWANKQDPVAYDHGASKTDNHGTLTLPYTHAMSKMTIEVVLNDAKANKPFKESNVLLNGMNTVATIDAPNGTITPSGTTADITMYKEPVANHTERYSFSAVFVPSQLTAGSTLATLTNIDGNDYSVDLKEDMITAWISQLKAGNITKSGVNYKLTVYVYKQKVTVSASIANWTTVDAEGTSKIDFQFDVSDSKNSTDDFAADLTTYATFDVYRLLYESGQTTGNTDYSKAASYSYTEGSGWTNSMTQLYWDNKTNQYYFRAVAPASRDLSTIFTAGTAADADVLWATTDEHQSDDEQHTFAQGAPIMPRTGDVPLTFVHAMCKVSVILQTSGDDAADKVSLAGATVTLTNLAKTGVLQLHDGSFAITSLDAEMFSGTSMSAYPCIPQAITDAARLKIQLADNTPYSLQLNQCTETSSGTTISAWENNKHYIYTITVTKEAVTFDVKVRNWEEVTGSGSANLEWD